MLLSIQEKVYIKKLKHYRIKNKQRDVKHENIFRHSLMESGIKYIRQKIINPYIVDFYFPKRNLVVEIDDDKKKKDSYFIKREDFIKKEGLHILHFLKSQIENNIEVCIDKVKEYPEIKRKKKNKLLKIKEIMISCINVKCCKRILINKLACIRCAN